MVTFNENDIAWQLDNMTTPVTGAIRLKEMNFAVEAMNVCQSALLGTGNNAMTVFLSDFIS